MSIFISKNAKTPYRFIDRDGKIYADKNGKQKDIKSIWPDFSIKPWGFGSRQDREINAKTFEVKLLYTIERMTVLQYDEATSFNKKCISLGILPTSHTLDIGAYKNAFLNLLGGFGFLNTRGIDTNSVICNFNGENVNIRDYDLRERFDIVHFSRLADYLSGGSLNKSRHPKIELFLSKVLWHLNENGYLFFTECCKDKILSRIENILTNYGFIKCSVSDKEMQVWRKVNVV
jgi:hypothetical protein